MSFLTQHRSSRGSVLLVAFLLSLAPASRAISGMPTTPGKLGAMTPSLCLLVAGSWFAFKEGGWFAKAFAVGVLALFGYGVSTGMDRAQGSHEVDSELSQIREDVARDAANGDVSAESTKRRLDSAEAAAARMKASTNSETAEFGRIVDVITTVNRELLHDLSGALEPVQSERFMNVQLMVDQDDFEWQHKVAADYLAAAKSAAIANETLVDTVCARLSKSGVESTSVRSVAKGVQRIQPFNARAMQAHIRSAIACEKMIAFVESHRSEIVFQEDGALRITKQESLDAYKLLQKDLDASAKALDAANRQGMNSAASGG